MSKEVVAFFNSKKITENKTETETSPNIILNVFQKVFVLASASLGVCFSVVMFLHLVSCVAGASVYTPHLHQLEKSFHVVKYISKHNTNSLRLLRCLKLQTLEFFMVLCVVLSKLHPAEECFPLVDSWEIAAPRYGHAQRVVCSINFFSRHKQCLTQMEPHRPTQGLQTVRVVRHYEIFKIGWVHTIQGVVG